MEKLSCLLIDDDMEEVEIFQMALEFFPDIQFAYFINSPGALQHLSNTPSPPDFIFVDLNMPVLRGEMLIAELRKLPHLRHTEIYTYSTSDLQQDKAESLSAGATGFVTKPLKLNALIEILKEIFKN